jgi:dimethylhistidine N-methyltransferase
MPLTADPGADTFLHDVLAGLSRPQKTIPSKYFYDERGSALFERICDQDEYYLTRTELALMRRHAAEMARALGPRCTIIEPGSGSGLKTRILLDHLKEPAGYVPIDVSCEQLQMAARRLVAAYPRLTVRPICADFTQRLNVPSIPGERRRVVYFPGSTIGNFTPGEVIALLKRIPGLGADGLLVGFDLEKDRETLERAYNDAAGVTAEFNLNILARINRELDADFDLARFAHHAYYNEAEHRIEMHLVSRTPQRVRIADRTIPFARGETIRTEYSYKFLKESFADCARAAGLSLELAWSDPARYFCIAYLTVHPSVAYRNAGK